MPARDPAAIVQRQLDAYNGHDIEALLAVYGADARQFEHPATLLASGADQIRARMTARFADSALHARLLQRVVMGNIVIDHELITYGTPEGTAAVEAVAIYEIANGKIQSASVKFTP